MKNRFSKILSLILALSAVLVLFASCGIAPQETAEKDEIKECSDTEMIDPDDPFTEDRLELSDSLEAVWKARLSFNAWGKAVFDNLDVTMRNALDRSDMALMYIDLTIDEKDTLVFSWDEAQLSAYREALSTALENMLINYARSETEENGDFDYSDEEIIENFKELGFDKDELLKIFDEKFNAAFKADGYTVNKAEKTIAVGENTWKYRFEGKTDLAISDTPFGTVTFSRMKTEDAAETEKADETAAESEKAPDTDAAEAAEESTAD